MTLGITYRHNNYLRVLADYEFRRVDAPGLSGGATPNRILAEVDDIFGVKVWVKF